MDLCLCIGMANKGSESKRLLPSNVLATNILVSEGRIGWSLVPAVHVHRNGLETLIFCLVLFIQN